MIVYIIVGLLLFFLLGNVFVSLIVYFKDELDIDFGCSTDICSDISLEWMPFILWPFAVIFFFLEASIIFIIAQFKILCYILSLGKNPITASKLFSLK